MQQTLEISERRDPQNRTYEPNGILSEAAQDVAEHEDHDDHREHYLSLKFKLTLGGRTRPRDVYRAFRTRRTSAAEWHLTTEA